MTKRTLTDEQLAALTAFAAEFGGCWPSMLVHKWVNGKDVAQPGGALLRQLRNRYGRRLFKLPEVRALNK